MPEHGNNKTLIVVVGPTAIGKTALSIVLAQHFATEIISADSRQFFKEMEIGTAKPSAEELSAATHHFINSHHIDTLFSIGDFESEVLQLAEKLFENHQTLVMVGGSGLYVDAVCNGLDQLPDTDLSVREELNTLLTTHGIAEIRRQLEQADPGYYAKVDQFNPQRMIRGLEFFLSTGEKFSAYMTNNRKSRPFKIVKIGLNTDRAILYERINNRVDLMMNNGLLEEVKQLTPYRDLNALKTVGYTELFNYLEGIITLDEAVDKIKQNTRRFAKRQLTWFRKDDQIHWFEPNEDLAVINYLESALGQA
ncbi:tRNA (adenosine(37)-N6)-dimethylallyltransferase MiaA [Pedobacter sp. MR2016-24]|uniref:tRNA (adenosine(37)-N6)-dimethylallyltransferase MiaA n=1 Tax=Pedobacter sp. MR2016-24 TaxID=2994466 RepID=UPI002247804D|nr:tRNA (adenosine(37)-N6)-dimethylallyltransferase MiaA [Pedobacter sp. MR2016-24]MCX2482603.1 tRNA (adenosine(37)-N6)-dimethylallyltransferase MiaA [Pedobacter sp. MR2016-24]